MKNNFNHKRIESVFSLFIFVLTLLLFAGGLISNLWEFNAPRWIELENHEDLARLEERLEEESIEYISSSNSILYYSFTQWDSVPIREADTFFHSADPRRTPGIQWMKSLFQDNTTERVYLISRMPEWLFTWKTRGIPLKQGFSLLNSINLILVFVFFLLAYLWGDRTIRRAFLHLIWFISIATILPQFYALGIGLYCLHQALTIAPFQKTIFIKFFAYLCSILLCILMKDWIFAALSLSLILLLKQERMSLVKRDHKLFEPILFSDAISLPKRTAIVSKNRTLILPATFLILSPVLLFLWFNHRQYTSAAVPSLNGIEVVDEHLLSQRRSSEYPLSQMPEGNVISIDRLEILNNGITWQEEEQINLDSLYDEILIQFPESIEAALYEYREEFLISNKKLAVFPWDFLLLSMIIFVLNILILQLDRWLPRRGTTVINRVKRRLKVA